MSQALGSDGDSWLLTKSLRAQVFMQKDRNMAKNCIEDSEYRGHPQGQPSHRVNSTGRDPGIQRENVNNQTPTLRYHSVAHGIFWYRRDQVQTPASSSTRCATEQT